MSLTTFQHRAVPPAIPGIGGEAPGTLVFPPRVAAVVGCMEEGRVDGGVTTVVVGGL